MNASLRLIALFAGIIELKAGNRKRFSGMKVRCGTLKVFSLQIISNIMISAKAKN